MTELLPLHCYEGPRNPWRVLTEQTTVILGIPPDELKRRMRLAERHLRDWVITEIALRHHPMPSDEQLRQVVNERWRRYLLTGD